MRDFKEAVFGGLAARAGRAPGRHQQPTTGKRALAYAQSSHKQIRFSISHIGDLRVNRQFEASFAELVTPALSEMSRMHGFFVANDTMAFADAIDGVLAHAKKRGALYLSDGALADLHDWILGEVLAAADEFEVALDQMDAGDVCFIWRGILLERVSDLARLTVAIRQELTERGLDNVVRTTHTLMGQAVRLTQQQRELEDILRNWEDQLARVRASNNVR